MSVFIRYLKNVFLDFKNKQALAIFKAKWRKKNKHNLTNAGRVFPINSVKVGHHSYGTLNVVSYEAPGEELDIGNYCSIAGNVFFLLSGEHYYKSMLTYPIEKLIISGKVESKSKGPIIVGDDVWIGFGSIILSGVTIGKGAIIAAGSVVAKNVPPYAIWINGAVFKYRFDKEIIDILDKMDYSKIDDDFIKSNSGLLTSVLSKDVANKIVDLYGEETK